VLRASFTAPFRSDLVPAFQFLMESCRRDCTQRTSAVDVAREKIDHAFVPERQVGCLASKGAMTTVTASATPVGTRFRRYTPVATAATATTATAAIFFLEMRRSRLTLIAREIWRDVARAPRAR